MRAGGNSGHDDVGTIRKFNPMFLACIIDPSKRFVHRSLVITYDFKLMCVFCGFWDTDTHDPPM